MKIKNTFIVMLLFGVFSITKAQNINVSNYILPDMEPYIAVNPTNANNVIAAWMKVTGVNEVSIAVSSSNDAGNTWTTPVNLPHLYSGFTHADVSISFNGSGKAFISYIDYAPTQDSGYIMVASSTTGGLTWGTPVKVISANESVDKPVDRPWIEVDRSGGTYDGRIYIVSKSISGALPYHIWMKHSSDDGLTWSSLKLLDSVPTGNTVGSMAALTVGNDGTVYIGYLSYDPSSSPFLRALLIKSGNGGISFTPPFTIGNFTGASAINDTLQGSITLSANPADVNNLIFTYTDGTSGDADVKSRYSTNKGNSWNLGPRLNSDAVGNGVEQDMSWAGFSPTGVYLAAWRDRRNTGTTAISPFEIYVTSSIDGGANFSTNYNISTVSSPDIPIQKGNDFIGVSLSASNIHLAWCDNRTGNYEVFTTSTPIATLTTSEKSRVESSSFKAFPNPAKNEIQFEFDVNIYTEATITIADMNGKIIRNLTGQTFQPGIHTTRVQIKDLKTGNYFYVVRGNSTEISIPFVKE